MIRLGTAVAGAAPLLGAVVAALAALPAHAQSTPEVARILGDGVQVACTQSSAGTTLECDFRLVRAEPVEKVRATLRGEALPAPTVRDRDPSEGVTAVLFLVDTSDPGRAAAIEHIAADVRRFVSLGGDRHHFGLAAFDSGLRMLAPIGSRPDEIAAAASGLRAVGKTTELYRNSLESIRILSAYPADRRALFVFSDGLAEDRAYFHDDVVAAARAGGVVIRSFGYPRSVALSVGLQSLRRLADETGGTYFGTDMDFELPADAFAAPFAAVEGGGTVRVDLSRVEPVEASRADGAVRLVFETAGAVASAVVPVALPVRVAEPVVRVVEVPKVVEVEKIVEVPVEKPAAASAPAASPPAPAAPLPPWRDPLTLYSGAAVLALLLVLVVLLVILLRTRRRGDGDAAQAPGGPPVRAFASVELRDGQRHPISSATYRIGRHADNDLTLRDPSISRYHAEIRRSREGEFTIIDLDSLNGVFVNNKKCKESEITDGDLLEVGDVSLKFSIQVHDELGDEETVVLKTVMPIAPLGEQESKRA